MNGIWHLCEFVPNQTIYICVKLTVHDEIVFFCAKILSDNVIRGNDIIMPKKILGCVSSFRDDIVPRYWSAAKRLPN